MPRPDGFEAARAGGGEEISVFAGFDLSVRAAEEMIKRRAFRNLKCRMQIESMACTCRSGWVKERGDALQRFISLPLLLVSISFLDIIAHHGGSGRAAPRR